MIDPRKLEQTKRKAIATLPKAIAVTRTVITIAIYFGFMVVIEALLSMESPPGQYNCPDCPWSYTPPVPPALQCLTTLTIQYFATYLAVYISGMYDLFQNSGYPSIVSRILEDTKETVKFCPMLSVLFIGARLRAMQLQTEPQDWAKTCFFFATYSILGQTIVSLMQPLLRLYRYNVNALFEILRWFFLFSLYAATVLVIHAVLTMELGEHLSGVETPEVSTAMKNIMSLLTQYFALFLAIQLLSSYANTYLRRAGDGETNLEIMLKAGIPSLDLIPMMAVLFIAARFRAIEVDPTDGESQPWAQNCMYLATFAILVQMIICIMIPYFSGEITLFDERAAMADPAQRMLQDVMKREYKGIAKRLSLFKFLAMLVVYSAVGGVSFSILSIKPNQDVAFA